ncbi:D-inositol 3-phosphate glycosyltransferase-like [Montipora capricornis]|uniref:D-inositol 3-phosphate glycosyltransferase-like n=1 Tax=Montipora capricornis TaxID=246305 RepID=UPI0035F17957
MASAPWKQPHEFDPNKVQVTILASEWESSTGGLSTINRELAIQLAKFPEVQVTYFLPKCSQEDKKVALSHGIKILEATRLLGFDELEWLSFPPEHLQIDVIVGHGVKLGRQAQVIRNSHKCQWVQVVHTDPEELGMFKSYKNPISRGEEKHNVEVELCKMANFVIGVGPKLAEAFRKYLCSCKKDQDVFEFTPGIFDEFVSVQQVPEERKQLSVLVFGGGDAEDFKLKGFDIAATSVAAIPDTRLVFVGAPDGKHEEIANRLLEYGISKNRLSVRGYVKTRDLKRLFCEMDLVLMPSRTEGFGLTGLEALSAGLPVIVSKNSGFGKALGNVPFGSSFVIDSEDPNAWTAAIKDIWNKDRQTRLVEAKVLRDSYGTKYRWSTQCSDLLQRIFKTLYCSSVPPEILARGSKAVYAYQKALQTGKVKVYRGRIIILGQPRAGKTSLKKSLLSLPFDPCQESTVGVEACEVEVDQVMNWTQSERKKPEESEFKDKIARLMAKDLIQTGADKKNVVQGGAPLPCRLGRRVSTLRAGSHWLCGMSGEAT